MSKLEWKESRGSANQSELNILKDKKNILKTKRSHSAFYGLIRESSHQIIGANKTSFALTTIGIFIFFPEFNQIIRSKICKNYVKILIFRNGNRFGLSQLSNMSCAFCRNSHSSRAFQIRVAFVQHQKKGLNSAKWKSANCFSGDQTGADKRRRICWAATFVTRWLLRQFWAWRNRLVNKRLSRIVYPFI